MKVSMNGIRINLVNAFNKFCSDETVSKLDADEVKALDEVAESIGVLLCIYDDDECTPLNDKYQVKRFFNEFFNESEE